MIEELTPENFFEHVTDEGILRVVMLYGSTCGPCKVTMPVYEAMASHFEQYNIPNIKFYKLHFWEKDYKPFFSEHKITASGVPTFKYYFYGDEVMELTRSFVDPNELKRETLNVMETIEKTIQGVFGHATS
jgi:thiol-disulfide isomerase/thioredoxin